MEALSNSQAVQPAHQDEVASTTEHEESLPFALPAGDPPKPQHHEVRGNSAPLPLSSESLLTEMSRLSNSSSLQPPALASSLISSPTDEESQSFSSPSRCYASSSLSHPGSQYLDAAASLLLPNSSLVLGIPRSSSSNETWASQELASSSTAPDEVAGFSQLLNEADNRHEARTPSSFPNRRLPVLPEEQPVVVSGSGNSFEGSPNTTRRPRFSSNPAWTEAQSSSHLMQSQQTIVAAASSVHRSPERRMASLAGATASRTSNTSFQVAVDLSSGCSLEDVMEVVGNPDLLRLWCDPVPSLVITQSSEGARNAANLRGHSEEGRLYEGEWIEATTNMLVPPKNTSCLYHTHRALKTALGIPSYATIQMFVERPLYKVGLTMGPFAGGVHVSHKMKIEQVSEHKVRILDQVQLQRDEDSSCCGLWEVLSSVFLPTVDDYMDQVLSSMARLRFLVENGEAMGYVPPTIEDTPSAPLLDSPV